MASALAPPAVAHLYISARLTGLQLEAAFAALELPDNVLETLHVLLDTVEPELTLVLALPIAADTSSLFKDPAAVDRIRREDSIDAPLLKDGVTPAADPCIKEHLAHILEAHLLTIDQILSLTTLEHTAGDGDLSPMSFDRPAGVVEDDASFGEGHPSATGRALEDDIRHLLATHGCRALLTEDPTDRIDDVALTTSIRTDDAGHGVISKVEDRSVSEGFKA